MKQTDGEMMRRVKEMGLMPRLVARYEAGWMPVAVTETDQLPMQLVAEVFRCFEAIEAAGGELPKVQPQPVAEAVRPDRTAQAVEVGTAVFQVGAVVVKGFATMAGAMFGGLVSGIAEGLRREPQPPEPFNPVQRVGRPQKSSVQTQNNIVVNGGNVIINNYNNRQ
jgi:hypothetical protein